MREKRTVVWERKAKATTFRTEAAERIRARLRPTAFTRITDAIVDRFESIGAWFDEKSFTKEHTDYDPRIKGIMLGTLAVVLGTAFFLDGGKPAMAGQFFGTLGAIILAMWSYDAWNRAHPLPPPHERTTMHELVAGLHGLAGGAFMFAATRVLDRTVEGGMGLSLPFSVFSALVAAFGVFMHRTGERKAEPRRNAFGIAIWAAAWLLGIALDFAVSAWP